MIVAFFFAQCFSVRSILLLTYHSLCVQWQNSTCLPPVFLIHIIIRLTIKSLCNLLWIFKLTIAPLFNFVNYGSFTWKGSSYWILLIWISSNKFIPIIDLINHCKSLWKTHNHSKRFPNARNKTDVPKSF